MPEFTLTPQNLPAGYCYPANPQEFLNLVAGYITVNFNEQLSFFNYGPTTPGVDYQDRPCIKTTVDGAPDGVWIFYNGTWRRNEYFKKGMIIPFYGDASAVELPWVICDGSAAINGVTIPDLRDKFIVGAGNAYSVADTGGEATHTLVGSEIPAHQHAVPILGPTPDLPGVYGGIDAGFTARTIEPSTSYSSGYYLTSSYGSSGAHNNLPPYEAFYWLIYVGYY